MSYQKCPICDGKGFATPSISSMNTSDLCDVCNGKKIISSLTGLPPKDTENKENDYLRKAYYDDFGKEIYYPKKDTIACDKCKEWEMTKTYIQRKSWNII